MSIFVYSGMAAELSRGRSYAKTMSRRFLCKSVSWYKPSRSGLGSMPVGSRGWLALMRCCWIVLSWYGFPAARATPIRNSHRRCARALEWDVLAPHTRIMSTAADGWVTLEGEVNVLQERQDAERYLQGMRGVQNRIAVRPPQVMPGRMHAVFEDALERCAARVAAPAKPNAFRCSERWRGDAHWSRPLLCGAARETSLLPWPPD